MLWKSIIISKSNNQNVRANTNYFQTINIQKQTLPLGLHLDHPLPGLLPCPVYIHCRWSCLMLTFVCMWGGGSRLQIFLYSRRVRVLLRWVHRGNLFVWPILELLQKNWIGLLRLWPSPNCFIRHVLGHHLPMPSDHSYRLLGWKKKAREDAPSVQLILDDTSKWQGINRMIRICLWSSTLTLTIIFVTPFNFLGSHWLLWMKEYLFNSLIKQSFHIKLE